MFQTVSQADAYFYSIAFYNRHVGEMVVMVAYYYNVIGNIFQ